MSSPSSTSTGARRPCLKRFTTPTPPPSSPPASSPLQRSRSVQHELTPSCPKPPSHASHVHFPPTPRLSTTFPTHSKKTYDRRPLVVEPNACAIPERGCPGRTYVLERTQSDPEVARRVRAPAPAPLPPYTRVREPGDDILDINIDDEDDGPEGPYLQTARSACAPSRSPGPAPYRPSCPVTPTMPASRTPPAALPALPALIPDHGVSSSESDESDALASPHALRCLTAPTAMSQPSLSPVEDERLVFLPHPPSPELWARDREREKEKEARRRRRREIEEERGKWKTHMLVRDDAASSCLGGF